MKKKPKSLRGYSPVVVTPTNWVGWVAETAINSGCTKEVAEALLLDALRNDRYYRAWAGRFVGGMCALIAKKKGVELKTLVGSKDQPFGTNDALLAKYPLTAEEAQKVADALPVAYFRISKETKVVSKLTDALRDLVWEMVADGKDVTAVLPILVAAGVTESEIAYCQAGRPEVTASVKALPATPEEWVEELIGDEEEEEEDSE